MLNKARLTKKKTTAVSVAILFSMALMSNLQAQNNDVSCQLNKPYKEHSLKQQQDFYTHCVKPEIRNSIDTAQYSQINQYGEWLKASGVPHLTESGVFSQTYTNQNAYETYVAFDGSTLPEESVVVTENFQIADNGQVTPQSIQVLIRKEDQRNSQTGQNEQVWDFMHIAANGDMRKFNDFKSMCPNAQMPQDCFEVPSKEALMH